MLELQLENQIKENEELKSKYNALHNKYDSLESNYNNLVERLSQLEVRSQLPNDNDLKDVSTSYTAASQPIQSEISEMKGEALSASTSITELQDVWSNVDNKLNSYIPELNDIQQYNVKTQYLLKV